jgi:hypothetical protein
MRSLPAKAQYRVQGRTQLMTHAGKERVFGGQSVLQFLFLLMKRLFERPKLAGIADKGDHLAIVRGLKEAQTDLHWKLAAVLALCLEVQRGVHRPDLRVPEEGRPVAHVSLMEPSRQ